MRQKPNENTTIKSLDNNAPLPVTVTVSPGSQSLVQVAVTPYVSKGLPSQDGLPEMEKRKADACRGNNDSSNSVQSCMIMDCLEYFIVIFYMVLCLLAVGAFVGVAVFTVSRRKTSKRVARKSCVISRVECDSTAEFVPSRAQIWLK